MPLPILPTTREEFDQLVRSALSNLYDISYLQTHPLADLLSDRETTLEKSQHLREILLGAIESMRPPSGVRAHSSGWRVYRILELRYIDGLSPNETMSVLALGRSQFYKAQAKVLEAICSLLWQDLDLENGQPSIPDIGDDAHDSNPSRKDAAMEEMERMRAQTTQTTVDLVQVLDELRSLTDSLAATRGTDVHYTSMQGLSIAHADRVMTRQAVLNAITYALDLVPGGVVEVMSFQQGSEIGIWFMAMKGKDQADSYPIVERQGVGLEVCRKLMAAMRGELRVSETERGYWVAHLVWKTSDTPMILVVDDNQGFVELVSRYLAGFNCRIVSVAGVAEAKAFLTQTTPTAIISDIMMPEEDGWEFLASVKAVPESANIPFFTCSALSEPQLAAMLGATAHLSKPLSQQDLVQALSPWL